MSWTTNANSGNKRRRNDSLSSYTKFDSSDESTSPKKVKPETAVWKNSIGKEENLSDVESELPEGSSKELLAGGSILPAQRAVEHITGLLEFAAKEDPQATMASLKALVPRYLQSVRSDIPPEDLTRNIKRYLQIAIRSKASPLSSVLVLTQGFLKTPDALKYFEGFPSMVPRPVHAYCRMKNLKMGVSEIKQITDMMNGDVKGKEAAEAEVQSERVSHLRALKEFLNTNNNLSLEQMNSIRGSIKRAEKQLNPEGPKATRTANPKKKAKREPMSAFDHFKSLHIDEIDPSLSEEKKEKKLRKKYGKLSDEMRALYEKLALRDS